MLLEKRQFAVINMAQKISDVIHTKEREILNNRQDFKRLINCFAYRQLFQYGDAVIPEVIIDGIVSVNRYEIVTDPLQAN
jgi:hypothetical protein